MATHHELLSQIIAKSSMRLCLESFCEQTAARMKSQT